MKRSTRFVSIMLAMLCVVTAVFGNIDVAQAAIVSETYEVPDGTFEEKIAYLRNVLPEGWYWNHWSESALGDKYTQKNLKVNGQSTTISTKPCTYHKGTEKDSCNKYWEGKRGIQCCGFARMMFKFVWEYHTSSSKVIDYSYPKSLDYLDSVKPGDMIWTGNHYIFVLAVDGDKFRVVHCNNDRKCGIEWDAIYTKDLITTRMKENKKGCITVPSTRVDEPEKDPKWVNYRVLWNSGLKMRVSAGTSATTVEVMPKDTVFKADMNRTRTADGYTWAYSQMDDGTSGWVAISNSEYCEPVNDNTWALEYYIKAIFHCTQTTLKKEPYAASDDVRTMSGDEDIITVAAYRNKYGNLWYETDEGGFVNENNVTYVKDVSNVYYDVNLYYENEIAKGSNFIFGGSISSPSDSVWAVDVKIVSRFDKEEILHTLNFTETVPLNAPIDVDFVNDYLAMYGYRCLDDLPVGEYELIMTPHNYEEEPLESYSFFIKITNACEHKRHCGSSQCIYCYQEYTGDNTEHDFTKMSDESIHWDLCVGCGFIAERSAHYRYCDEELCDECGGSYTETEIYHYDVAYVGDESGHREFCVVCGFTGNEGEHVRLCDQTSCKYCGYAYTGSNITHADEKWSSKDNLHWTDCAGCGYTSEASEHYRFCDGERCWLCGANYSGNNITHAAEEVVGDEEGHYWYCYMCGEATSDKTAHFRWCTEEVCGACLTPYTGSNIEHQGETVVDKGMEPTCTATGLSEGSHCSTCGGILIAQQEIPSLGHSKTTIPGIPATHKTTGLTEGAVCGRCGEVLCAQAEIPVADAIKAYIPAGTKTVKKHSFANTGMECVIIPTGCISIEQNAFAGNAKIRFVEIPASVEFIDDMAFAGCREGLVIVTTEGSFAHSYAQENGILFVLVERLS